MHGVSLGAQFTDGLNAWSRSEHSHRAGASHRAEGPEHRGLSTASRAPNSSDSDRINTQGSIQQTLVNRIRVKLYQRFEVHQSSVAVAGATADEQAASDLAGAVSSALKSLSATKPKEAVAAVDETASEAIEQTAQALPSSGSAGGPAGLDAAISQIKDQLKSLFSAYLSNTDAARSADSVTATGAKLKSSAKGILEIKTLEGDTITLNFASRSKASLQNLQASNGTFQLDSTEFQAFSKSRVSISVQGDLNESELLAVQDLVDQVSQLTDGFFSGDLNAALSQASDLKLDSSQLSSYSLHLALRQTFEAFGLNLNLPPAAETLPSDSGATDAVDTTPADPIVESVVDYNELTGGVQNAVTG
jgi:hypothetical protein